MYLMSNELTAEIVLKYKHEQDETTPICHSKSPFMLFIMH